MQFITFITRTKKDNLLPTQTSIYIRIYLCCTWAMVVRASPTITSFRAYICLVFIMNTVDSGQQVWQSRCCLRTISGIAAAAVRLPFANLLVFTADADNFIFAIVLRCRLNIVIKGYHGLNQTNTRIELNTYIIIIYRLFLIMPSVRNLVRMRCHFAWILWSTSICFVSVILHTFLLFTFQWSNSIPKPIFYRGKKSQYFSRKHKISWLEPKHTK